MDDNENYKENDKMEKLHTKITIKIYAALVGASKPSKNDEIFFQECYDKAVEAAEFFIERERELME